MGLPALRSQLPTNPLDPPIPLNVAGVQRLAAGMVPSLAAAPAGALEHLMLSCALLCSLLSCRALSCLVLCFLSCLWCSSLLILCFLYFCGYLLFIYVWLLCFSLFLPTGCYFMSFPLLFVSYASVSFQFFFHIFVFLFCTFWFRVCSCRLFPFGLVTFVPLLVTTASSSCSSFC